MEQGMVEMKCSEVGNGRDGVFQKLGMAEDGNG